MKRTLIIIPALATIILSLSLTGCENTPENNNNNTPTPQEQPTENENSQQDSQEESYE